MNPDDPDDGDEEEEEEQEADADDDDEPEELDDFGFSFSDQPDFPEGRGLGLPSRAPIAAPTYSFLVGREFSVRPRPSAAPAVAAAQLLRCQNTAELTGHNGCVNTLEARGSLLLSGSDDTQLIVWDMALPEAQAMVAAARPGHTANIFCAQWLRDDASRTVSCSRDGRVVLYDWLASAPLRTWRCSHGVAVKVRPLWCAAFHSSHAAAA